MSFNEGKACDAVLRIIEARMGAQRQGLSRPERSPGEPPVELRVTIGKQKYAIEHTGLEAFPEQLKNAQIFGELINPIVGQLNGFLPKPGVYSLLFPLRTAVGKALISQTQQEIVSWVRAAAKRMTDAIPDVPSRDTLPGGRSQEETIKISTLDLVLRRELHWSRSGKHDGKLVVSRFGPPNLEEMRRVRIKTALDRKLSKLKDCAKSGDRTVLICEDEDIALSNHAIIGETVLRELEGRVSQPDEIYIVESSIERWTVFCLLLDGVKWPHEELENGRYFEFMLSELEDMTRSSGGEASI